MHEQRIELTDELVQRYCDGELDQDLRLRVEKALELNPEHSRAARRYRSLGSLLHGYAADIAPDELTVRRNWDGISRRLSAPARPFYRRKLPWLSVAAAAVLAVFVFGPFEQARSAEAVVDSIDCTYPSFMLLSPDQEGSHTIIWINDSGN